MNKNNILYYGNIVLITAEIALIGFLDYIFGRLAPAEIGHYISLDVLFCLPIIQTARLVSIHATRQSDQQTSTLVGITIALVWSAVEAAIIWPNFPLNALLLNVFTRSVVFTVIGRVVLKLWRERECAYHDSLTGLGSRSGFIEQFELEQKRSERSQRPYSILFIDIDQFKKMNDNFGHQVGDQALIVVADILRKSSRKADVAARYGGDEFLVLLPETNEKFCAIIVNRIEESAKKIFSDNAWPISLSIGRMTNIGMNKRVDEVIRLADEGMYKVKKMKKK